MNSHYLTTTVTVNINITNSLNICVHYTKYKHLNDKYSLTSVAKINKFTIAAYSKLLVIKIISRFTTYVTLQSVKPIHI